MKILPAKLPLNAVDETVTLAGLTNVTAGAFLLIDATIGTNDQLVLNTDYRTVTLNGVNRRALLNNSSTWFAAPPGTSYYTFTATGTDGNTACVVTWRNAYI